MDSIAVTGFAFKLPGGADDEASLWSILSEGRNVMTEYAPTRINLESFYNGEKTRNNTVRIN
jgi:acyl transferase domain-containing protein